MFMELPESVIKIIQKLEANGFEAYAVGGCVRDALLGLTPDDWDITTSAEPEQVKAIFHRTIDTGIKHGTVTVRLGGESFEVTTYRIDGKYEDGRHPEEVTFTKSLEEDLKRRDFTINAMAVNPGTGIVDLFDGQEDLKNGVIRCVGNPVERFSEDALRMMRAVRFAAKLDFTIEEKTRAAILELKDNLRKVSAERIQTELTKLITSGHPELMRTLYETGLTSVFFPEWDVAMLCPQNTKHHCHTVGEHTIEVMKQVRADKVMRLAAMLHDIGKPTVRRTDKKGHDHFQGHPMMSEVLAERILKRLKYDNDTIHRVCMLVRYHDERPAPNPRSIRNCMREMDLEPSDLFELKRADIAGQSEYRREEKLKAVDEFERLWEENRRQGNCTDRKHLAVTGKDLMDAGVEKGPQMGRILEKLLDDVIDEPALNEKQTLISKAGTYGRLAWAGRLLLAFAVVLFCGIGALTACGSIAGSGSTNRIVSYRKPGVPVGQASGDASEEKETDSLDEVYLIEENDGDNGRLTVMNVTSLREFRYPYNVSTEFLDKYGNNAVAEDFKPGMAVTLDSSGRYGTLVRVQKSDAVWEWDDVTNFSFDDSQNLMKIGDSRYQVTDSTLVLDGNLPAQTSDLVSGVDRIRVVGVDKRILSIAMEQGHGYLMLSNTSRFDDSLIQVGSYDAGQVSDGKTFTLPTGTYAVTVANDGWGSTKNVKIKKGETKVLDLESMKGKGPKTCKLTFEINVDGASIYLDGNLVEADKEMSVIYGVHSLKVTADGYDDWNRTLYVNSPEATISLDISDSKQGGSTSADTEASGTDTSSGTENSMESEDTGSDSDGNGSGTESGSGSTGGSEGSTASSLSGSSSTTQDERDKASEEYLSTLADSIVNAVSGSTSD